MFACNRVCSHNERVSLFTRKHDDEALPANLSSSPEQKSFRGTLIDMGLCKLNNIITNAMDRSAPKAPSNGPVT